MRLSALSLFSSVCIISGAALAFQKEQKPLPVVPRVDLQRYQGKWFEIARLPARFERDCAGDVTAEYSLRSDGAVQVINTCRKADGHSQSAKGIARRRNTNGPASQLKVRFFWPFYGDYWILDLDPDYRWALVGTPNRRYLWILSRSPEMTDHVYRQLLSKAHGLGFEVRRVRRTTQTTKTA